LSASHNTFARNSDAGLCTKVGNTPKLYNNIFYGNGSSDYSAVAGHPLMVANSYGSYSGPSLASGSAANLTSNPLFVNAAAGNFNLQTTSPAVNSGADNVPGGEPSSDIDGGPRVIGSHPDRGAYESGVTDAFFQTVTNTNDSGAGSLRQAIMNANAGSGYHIVNFDIPGSCPHRIDVDSLLPDITQAVLIDGYSQPGSQRNGQLASDDAIWCVQLNGENARQSGLQVPAAAAANVQLWVQGLAFGSFVNAAIALEGGSGHVIEGNYFGDGPAVLDANGQNIYLGAASSGTRIGGPDAEQRNVIVAADTYGVYVQGSGTGQFATGSHDNAIINNFIGVRTNGTSAGGNLIGAAIFGYSNTIEDNVISGNGIDGIDLYGLGAVGNTIQNNRIGLNAGPCFPQCAPDLPNGGPGVRIGQGAHDNEIGSNTISYNGAAGVRVESGNHNAIMFNTMHANGGLGIDLDATGVAPNDNDGGVLPLGLANGLINYPVLQLAFGSATAGTVTGNLQTANGDYVIEVYASSSCDASGYGEADRFLRSYAVSVTNGQPGQNGSVGFSIPLMHSTGLIGQSIAALTRGKVNGDTSELSACIVYTDRIFADNFEGGGKL